MHAGADDVLGDRAAERARPLKDRAWWIFLVLMAPVVGLYLFGPAALNSGPVFNVIGLSAVVAILLGVRMNRPSVPVAWYLIALGLALFVTGDVLAYNYERFFGTATPFPSLADVFYLSVFPTIVVGLLLLIRRRNRGRDWASIIDSLIITTGLGLLSWIFLMAPYAHASLSAPVKLTSIAYPLMDLLLLAVAVRLAVSGGDRSTSYYLTVISICMLFATDAVYGWLQLHSEYQSGGLLEAGWIGFYLLWGAAALHPSMAAEAGTAKPMRLTRPRLLVLTLATFVAPLTGLFGPTTTSDRIVIAGIAMVLFSLVLLRMVDLVKRQEVASSRVRALQVKTDELRELHRLKDRFMATVSHELRTPLTSIQGYLELLLEDEDGTLAQEQRQFISIVERNTERLGVLIEDLLLVSELDGDKLELDLALLDLGALAQESLDSVRSEAGTAGIELELTAESAVSLTGDRLRLAQLVDNVLSNALKFTPRDGRVSVRVTQAGDSAVLEVEDTGMGIAADEQEQVFDRFFRTRAAGANAIQGTGLGLSTSQAIAHAHGGVIDFTSEENVGTTFRVSLPCVFHQLGEPVADAPAIPLVAGAGR